MYKLFNYLFGWDYIQWNNSADQGITRVYIDYNDKCWFWQYRYTKVTKFITHKDEVIWLTCKPEKYLNGE